MFLFGNRHKIWKRQPLSPIDGALNPQKVQNMRDQAIAFLRHMLIKYKCKEFATRKDGYPSFQNISFQKAVYCLFGFDKGQSF